MPPRRAQRHRNVDALYGREEADEMEQRINENFNEKLTEGIGRLERMMMDINQNQRRVSPESNHGGSRASLHSNQGRSEHRSVDRRSVDREYGYDEVRDRRNDGAHNRHGRRDDGVHNHHARRGVGAQNRHRDFSDYEEEFDRGSVHYRDHGHGRNRDRDSVDDRRWESGMKMEIPEFKGGMVAEEFLD